MRSNRSPRRCGRRSANIKRVPAAAFGDWFGDDIRTILLAYVDFLRAELGWGPNDPLLPRTKQTATRAHGFAICGLDRQHWKTPESAREILRKVCAAAEVPYFTPHSVRRTVVAVGLQRCSNGEEFKAWSQNMAHDETSTTWRCYGAMPERRQAELVGQLTGEVAEPSVGMERLLDELEKRLRKA